MAAGYGTAESLDRTGLCGPAGYMLSSENPLNAAMCDLSDVCQSFVPGIGECKCGSPGLCAVDGD
jgi:hypothetical protein